MNDQPTMSRKARLLAAIIAFVIAFVVIYALRHVL